MLYGNSYQRNQADLSIWQSMYSAQERKLDSRFLPNIILAGAPKCGTTSIFDHLKDHPEICASSVKETYYLMDREYPLFKASLNIQSNGLSGYRKYFSHCIDAPARLKMEATPDYLYQKTPLEVIPSWPILPKVFFILRRPEERVLSLYRFAQNNVGVLDKRISFGEFLENIGRKDGLLSNRFILNNAIEHSKYINYLLHWRNVIGDENIRIFLMEDFRENPREFMEAVSLYLGIDSSFYLHYDFTVKNESYKIRNQLIHRWKRGITPYIRNERIRSTLAAFYRKANLSGTPSLTNSERSELDKLASHFTASNSQLEREFGVDLSHWRMSNVSK